MRTLRCPRCSQTVQVAEGERPVCPHCAHGAPAQAAAGAGAPSAPQAPAAPSTPTPAPVAAAPATPTKGKKGMVVALVAVGVLVVAAVAAATVYVGVLPDDAAPSTLSQEEAQDRVALAMEAFADDMEAGGDVRALHATMEMEDGGDGFFAGGAMTADFTMEWGRDGVKHMSVEVDQGPVSVRFALICLDDRSIISYGGDAYEQRGSMWGDCDGLIEDEGQEEFLFTSLEEDGLVFEEVVVHDDGSITATAVNETATMRVEVDPSGRITAMTIDDEEGHMEMTVEYGPRATIPVPTDVERLPADVSGYGSWSDGTYSWEAGFWAGGNYSVDEFEVRVMDGETVIASFPLEAGAQSEAGITFGFDETGDGLLGSGDTFELVADREYEVVVWDRWADRPITDDVDVPGPAVGLLLAGLVAVAWRRR